MHDNSAFTILVDGSDSGQRLDLFIASRISVTSRSAAADLIRKGTIKIQGEAKKPGYRVRAGDEIRGCIPAPVPVPFAPEPMDIDILYQDEHLAVVNKQPGLVVHPAPGHYTGTLVNGLLHHFPDLKGIGGQLRPGIVHRLDKDTSGALVVAKTAAAHHHLAGQFKSRRIEKTYLALVHGEMTSGSGTISLAIGRHPVDRKRMSTRSRKSRSAETSWKVAERFCGVTLIEIDLKTGRTHQIRVHCKAINHPVLGDPVYGGRKAGKILFKGEEDATPVPRQMLHAWRLGFDHPATETAISVEAPLYRDMESLIGELRRMNENV